MGGLGLTNNHTLGPKLASFLWKKFPFWLLLQSSSPTPATDHRPCVPALLFRRRRRQRQRLDSAMRWSRPLLPSDTTAAASTCSASPSHTPVSKPSSASAAEERSLVKSAISTVYTRRNTAQKRRTNDNTPFPAGTSSCPPPATLARKPLWLRTKSTRMENTSSGKHMLPEDFVKNQRAYFEEVDAFELPEEEASETDLE
uniref:Sororin C-terminal region domain-containing protein n=1 Tax=Oryza rufipogon TaxID=4529 RepID=A0A0E0R3B2_ORYRU